MIRFSLTTLTALVAVVAWVAQPATAQPSATDLVAAWTQLGPDGVASARAITRAASCPTIRLDGATAVMNQRAAPSPSFDVRSCEATLPRTTQRVSIGARTLPVSRGRARRIAVIGDTGCRLKFPESQACNDPKAWPFAEIARRVAALKPDLIVHVGDYYYRETPCAFADCAGSPHGAAWPSWEADWFAPAMPLFEAAPLVLVRGNHEKCGRGGEGWDRFLAPFAYGTCTENEALYGVPVDGLRLIVLDSSDAPDRRGKPEQVERFRAQFALIRASATVPTWLLSHRPLWALQGGLLGGTTALNETLQAAAGGPTLPVALAISGHVHLFEALRFADRRAPQIVVGDSGDELSRAPAQVHGVRVDGTTIDGGVVREAFGYALIDRDRSSVTAYDRDGSAVFACRFATGTIDCAPAAGRP